MRRHALRKAIGVLIVSTGWLISITARAQTWETKTLGGLSTHVYTPASGPVVGSGRGLLVGLHGCTQSKDALKARGNFEGAAEDYGLVVALPDVPNGGVYAGCWDYYGTAHTRTSRHDDDVLALVDDLLADAALNVDPAQVYVAGLSSGGGEAVVLGCLAPDVFAGVGVVAGPAAGTDASEYSSVSTTASEAAAVCEGWAGSAAADFDTQLVSVIAGTNDYTVAQGYVELNADAFGQVYGGDLQSADLDVAGLSGYQPQGTGEIRSDGDGPRISLIHADGMGHAWPGGSGAGPEVDFVASEGVNYAAYLGQFFSQNNRRAAPRPKIVELTATADQQARSIHVSGVAEGPGAAVASVTVSLTGQHPQGPAMLQPAAAGAFEKTFTDLPADAWYTPAAYAIDANGVVGETVLGDPLAIGQPPENAPPAIVFGNIWVAGGCATIPGTVTDDGAVTAAELELDGAVHSLTLDAAGAWSFERCGLTSGCYTPSVHATDELGNEATAFGPAFAVGEGTCADPDPPLRSGCACAVVPARAPSRMALLWLGLVVGVFVHRKRKWLTLPGPARYKASPEEQEGP